MPQYQGKHLLVDSRCGHGQALTNVDLGKACLMDIVEAIDMTMVLPPVSVKFPKPDDELTQVLQSLENEGLGQSKTARDIRTDLRARAHLYNGYSSFVMIAESHLSLHTFPEADFLSFDCYSCKGFDQALVLEILDETFRMRDPKIQVLSREFPGLAERPSVANMEDLLARRALKTASSRQV